MKLYYPVRNPINPNNPFGREDPMYTALGQKGHPGVDFECPSGTPVYSPCDGAAFYATDKEGGCGLYIRTPDTPYPTDNIILWHMYPRGTPGFPYAINVEDGVVTDVKAGQLLGYSDNSGYPAESTASHLHMGKMPIGRNELAVDPHNGYLGCVDPMPFFNGLFAEDISGLHEDIVSAISATTAAVQSVQQAQVPIEQKQQFLATIEKVVKELLQDIQSL